jgi:hypothetical protein
VPDNACPIFFLTTHGWDKYLRYIQAAVQKLGLAAWQMTLPMVVNTKNVILVGYVCGILLLRGWNI